MTKTKIDYSKGLIYKIVCNDLECKDIYVGSTTNFRQRKTIHKCSCNNENSKGYNIKIYKIIRDNGGWDNWDMIEIEKYPCNDGNELRARERVKYEELQGNMNCNIPNRGIIEYQKKYKKKHNKEYYENNKEKIKERNKNNKEKVKAYSKEYYENNKEKIKERNSIKISCVCGCIIIKNTKYYHIRSKKHQKYIQSIEPPQIQ